METHNAQTVRRLNELTSQTTATLSEQAKHSIQLVRHASEIAAIFTTLTSHANDFRGLEKAMLLVQESKANECDLVELKRDYKKHAFDIGRDVDKCTNLVESCSNYMEKYLPLYI